MQKDFANSNNKRERDGGSSTSGNNKSVVIENIKGIAKSNFLFIPQSYFASVGNNVVARVRDNELYGIIISIKQGFGFIQSLYSDEQVYFSKREYYQNIKVNDLVGYVPWQGPKGPAAQNVRALIPQISKLLTNVQGTIIRSNELHRVGCGIVDVVNNLTGIDAEAKTMLKNKYNNQIAFRSHDIIASLLPNNRCLDRGDVVTMTLSRMHDSNFFLASMIHSKLHNKKVMSDQIQRMLDAGIPREIGVISTVKNKEYGFIRGQDRKEEIFFRVDDAIDDKEEIVEGVEMEFFVIAEMIRGRLCDRAIYLKVIATGTVQYEVVVASDILFVVTKEPNGEESPGTGKLQHAIDISELMKSPADTTISSTIKEIDLWQRCLPDDMLIRKGDTLSINVHFYRPEKIFFARSVRIAQYLLLGRDTGIICAIKENNRFGFITSDSREIDLYFRLNAVVDSKGRVFANNDVKKGMKVSFDVVVEDGKVRAIRVQQVLDNHGSKDDDSSRYVLKKNVSGTILHDLKGPIGYVELTPLKWKEINDLVFLDPHIVASIANFMNNETLQKTEIHGLPVSIRLAYYDILDKLFPSLRHESIAIPAMEKIANLDSNVVFKTLKIWKEGKSANPENTQDLNTLTKDGKPKGGYILTFGKDDIAMMNDGFVGPMPGNVEVLFDVWWDKTKGRKAAKNIRLIGEEAMPDMPDEYVGLFENGGSKHGIVGMVFWNTVFPQQDLQDYTYPGKSSWGSMFNHEFSYIHQWDLVMG